MQPPSSNGTNQQPSAAALRRKEEEEEEEDGSVASEEEVSPHEQRMRVALSYLDKILIDSKWVFLFSHSYI